MLLPQRFKNKEKMALKGTKFPKEFSEKVDIRKVNLSSESKTALSDVPSSDWDNGHQSCGHG